MQQQANAIKVIEEENDYKYSEEAEEEQQNVDQYEAAAKNKNIQEDAIVRQQQQQQQQQYAQNQIIQKQQQDFLRSDYLDSKNTIENIQNGLPHDLTKRENIITEQNLLISNNPQAGGDIQDTDFLSQYDQDLEDSQELINSRYFLISDPNDMYWDLARNRGICLLQRQNDKIERILQQCEHAVLIFYNDARRVVWGFGEMISDIDEIKYIKDDLEYRPDYYQFYMRVRWVYFAPLMSSLFQTIVNELATAYQNNPHAKKNVLFSKTKVWEIDGPAGERVLEQFYHFDNKMHMLYVPEPKQPAPTAPVLPIQQEKSPIQEEKTEQQSNEAENLDQNNLESDQIIENKENETQNDSNQLTEHDKKSENLEGVEQTGNLKGWPYQTNDASNILLYQKFMQYYPYMLQQNNGGKLSQTYQALMMSQFQQMMLNNNTLVPKMAIGIAQGQGQGQGQGQTQNERGKLHEKKGSPNRKISLDQVSSASREYSRQNKLRFTEPEKKQPGKTRRKKGSHDYEVDEEDYSSEQRTKREDNSKKHTSKKNLGKLHSKKQSSHQRKSQSPKKHSSGAEDRERKSNASFQSRSDSIEEEKVLNVASGGRTQGKKSELDKIKDIYGQESENQDADKSSQDKKSPSIQAIQEESDRDIDDLTGGESASGREEEEEEEEAAADTLRKEMKKKRKESARSPVSSSVQIKKIGERKKASAHRSRSRSQEHKHHTSKKKHAKKHEKKKREESPIRKGSSHRNSHSKSPSKKKNAHNDYDDYNDDRDIKDDSKKQRQESRKVDRGREKDRSKKERHSKDTTERSEKGNKKEGAKRSEVTSSKNLVQQGDDTPKSVANAPQLLKQRKTITLGDSSKSEIKLVGKSEGIKQLTLIKKDQKGRAVDRIIKKNN